jgi:DNA-directed RNA polymerase specialized sigma24 family protein
MVVLALSSADDGGDVVRDADAEALIGRLLAGDETAWPSLWRALEPGLLATLRRPYFLGALSQREDDCRNIVVEAMARLRADGYARLRAYAEARREKPGLVFMAWLLVVAKRVAIDYMRAHEEYHDRRREPGASSPGAWRVLDTLVADSRSPGARPSITDEATVHEVLTSARDLPDDQRAALSGWLAGQDFSEIASARGLPSPKDAERAVRAALERLRRRFPRGEAS